MIDKTDKNLSGETPKQPSRRRFLGNLGANAAALVAANSLNLTNEVQAQTKKTPFKTSRRSRARRLRHEAADFHYQRTPENPLYPTNGDEELYPNKIAAFSKGLPHKSNGEVDLAAYQTLMNALKTGDPQEFEKISLGGYRRLTNPQCGYAFNLEGGDSQSYQMKPPPKFASREQAAEMAENYWMAVLRDVNFLEYADDEKAHNAAADLNRFGADFCGAKNENGKVTPENLFRGLTEGDAVGPLMSQFWFTPTRFGAHWIDTRIRTVMNPAEGGGDYLTTFESFLANQNGSRWEEMIYDPVLRWMRNGRDLGEWVHVDVLFQGYFQSLLILLGYGIEPDAGNPYNFSRTQDAFGTLGGPYIASLVCQVSQNALRAAWFQKWCVHRRLRPENFGGRIYQVLKNKAAYPVHREILDSLASRDRLGKYLPENQYGLLPIAYPEGCPTHPAYAAGHATVAGACVTILKAFFKEDALFKAPVVPSADGKRLLNYINADSTYLTVGGELNKIASNVALGRNIAGVHWRSDATESLILGEQVAIDLLRDQKATFNEKFDGFELTKFDGTKIIA